VFDRSVTYAGVVNGNQVGHIKPMRGIYAKVIRYLHICS
jgi:hypothetical protein